MKLDILIESILYFKGEPISKMELGKILEISQETLKESLGVLKRNLENRGVCLIETEEEVSLGTSPEATDIIENIKKDELNKDIGRSGLETLTIVAYKGPISRSGIDNIRGVNSSFILRNLLIRGLVERIPNPNDQRTFLYKPTMELLKYLGFTSFENLPEYNSIIKEMEGVIQEEQPMEDDSK